jgi:RNA polymerase sigma factor for flagellar operon FliA
MGTNITHPAGQQVVVQSYFNLVETISSKIKRSLPADVDVQDLVQTGMISLLEASSCYDISPAVEFSTDASSRITGAILHELQSWDTRSCQERKNACQTEQPKKQLKAKTGKDPASAQIAEAVGLGLQEYERTLQHLESARQSLFNAKRRSSAPRISLLVQ